MRFINSSGTIRTTLVFVAFALVAPFFLNWRDTLWHRSANDLGKVESVETTRTSAWVTRIVDGDTINNDWVDVIINPDKITSLTGVI